MLETMCTECICTICTTPVHHNNSKWGYAWERNQPAEIQWQSLWKPCILGRCGKTYVAPEQIHKNGPFFTGHPAMARTQCRGITNGRTAGADYFIRIADEDTGSVVAETSEFSIIDPAPDPSITVVMPTSTTQCQAGTSTCEIAWSTVGAVGSTVAIEYIKEGSSFLIEDSLLFGASPYMWSVPASGLSAGTGYYIRIKSNSNAAVNDVMKHSKRSASISGLHPPKMMFG